MSASPEIRAKVRQRLKRQETSPQRCSCFGKACEVVGIGVEGQSVLYEFDCPDCTDEMLDLFLMSPEWSERIVITSPTTFSFRCDTPRLAILYAACFRPNDPCICVPDDSDES